MDFLIVQKFVYINKNCNRHIGCVVKLGILNCSEKCSMRDILLLPVYHYSGECGIVKLAVCWTQAGQEQFYDIFFTF